MKKRDTARALAKFKARSTHKRKSKKKSVDAILREIENTGVAFDGVRISDSTDGGRRERASTKSRKDEIRTEGVFSGARGGFGFVTVSESDGRDIFIPEGRTGGAIDGDFVEVIYHTYRGYTGEEKTEGRVTKILKEGRDIFVGTLERERSGRRYGRVKERLLFIPDDARVALEPIVRDAAGARVGEKVAVRIKRNTGSHYSPECEVVAVLGEPDSREANYEAILLECGIPTEFSEDELRDAVTAASMPIDFDSREDRRSDVIFTIDGAGAKDLDDAVSLRRTSSGWLLGVHIADVSHYVREKTALDRAVMNRGTSVYFVDKVVPMLPEVLSNGVCSLNAGEDKCALSAFIKLSPDGEIRDLRIAKTVIRSRVRGVYSEVNAIFSGDADKDTLSKYKDVIPQLMRMRELYEILKARASSRGMLELEIPESVIMLDESGEPVGIRAAERGIGERLIEQFMLTANEAVAKKLREAGIPCVYRVHEYPPEGKQREFLTYVNNLGIDIRGIDPEHPSADDLSGILIKAEKAGMFAPVSYFLLRSMAKAKYSAQPLGHFGLGLSDYCHFTSPIRRLSDLATHRIIHKVLLEGKRAGAYSSYANRASVAATEAELRAVGAERRIENLYKTIYMRSMVGECFDATVSSVTSFGMFVMLDNTCEGLVPLEDMPGYFIYDEKNISLRCGSDSYRVGDSVKVRLEDADIARCKLRFTIML
ncbi:MAG: VacB/RNase II family 3'-5' exoribonuclease [Clostridia bacterium]|nr:VacB/RNase II family 3'-5' exoribonuclease [Clostridia bacterium]